MEGKKMKPFMDKDFSSCQTDTAQKAVLRLCSEPHLISRLSLPHQPAGDLRGPPVRKHHSGMARRRPLQMALHAFLRRGRTLHHRATLPDRREILSVGSGAQAKPSATRSSTRGATWSCRNISAINGVLNTNTAEEVWELCNASACRPSRM